MPDSTDTETGAANAPVFLHDSYLAWCAEQGVPVIEEFGINLMRIDVAPWDRYGMHGAVCLLKGRDDFNSIFCQLLEAEDALVLMEKIKPILLRSLICSMSVVLWIPGLTYTKRKIFLIFWSVWPF